VSTNPLLAKHFPDFTGSEEGLAAFEELFLYACPKFIASSPPPYEDPDALALYLQSPPLEPAQRHLTIFLGDVRALANVPTLRSFLKLYTSLDASKLANFLDMKEEPKEEVLVQQLMGLKLASRSISRAGMEGGRLLDGETISSSDTDFAINEVRVCSQHQSMTYISRRS
jgi:translation initiation factor 3 subunit L